MNIKTKVKLISFNGETVAPDDCDPAEDYWFAEKIQEQLGSRAGRPRGCRGRERKLVAWWHMEGYGGTNQKHNTRG